MRRALRQGVLQEGRAPGKRDDRGDTPQDPVDEILYESILAEGVGRKMGLALHLASVPLMALLGQFQVPYAAGMIGELRQHALQHAGHLSHLFGDVVQYREHLRVVFRIHVESLSFPFGLLLRRGVLGAVILAHLGDDAHRGHGGQARKPCNEMRVQAVQF